MPFIHVVHVDMISRSFVIRPIIINVNTLVITIIYFLEDLDLFKIYYFRKSFKAYGRDTPACNFNE